jgi:hypothetical protein
MVLRCILDEGAVGFSKKQAVRALLAFLFLAVTMMTGHIPQAAKQTPRQSQEEFATQVRQNLVRDRIVS